jgi:hypothetical protein
LPSFRALQNHRGAGAKNRKTMRKDDELVMPTDIDIDFLKVRLG